MCAWIRGYLFSRSLMYQFNLIQWPLLPHKTTQICPKYRGRFITSPSAGLSVCKYDSQHHVVTLLLPIPEQTEWILTRQWSLIMCGLQMVLQCLSIAFCSTKSVLEQHYCKVCATDKCHKFSKKKHSFDTAMLKEHYINSKTILNKIDAGQKTQKNLNSSKMRHD
jgi:hypothetical protein